MRALIFNGPSRFRVLGPDDGMTTELRFERGVALEVAEANADAILSNPDLTDSFTEAPSRGPSSSKRSED